MTSAPGGVIQLLSASQVEEFDPEQVGGCPRRWWFHHVGRLPVPESDNARADGDAGHALFAMYYRIGQRPRRAKMAKAVSGALDAGHLPAREPGQLVESRFDGQPARDANGERLPLRHSTTLWLGGIPWDGYVDLRFRRDDRITVLDHKFSSDIHTYAKSDLLATVQMPVYALDSLRVWPDAKHVELMHHYVSRRGVDSFVRRQLVTVEQIRQRGEEIAGLVKQMQEAARAPSAEDVPGNRASCHTWNGCPFQSRCSAFKEKPKMDLNPEEMEWLNVVGGGEVTQQKEEKLRCELCGGIPDHVHGDCPSLTKPPVLSSDADRATELEVASAVGALDSADDPFAVFAPQASVPQEQSAPLTVETTKPADGAKCPDCPHLAHSGAPCMGKRGRGACRCGAQGTVEKQQDAAALAGGHLPTCVQNDAGKWLCMDGCTAVAVTGTELVAVAYQQANPGSAKGADLPPPGVADDAVALIQSQDPAWIRLHADFARERDMHRRTLGELDAVHRELERLRSQQRPEGAPIPMLLWCPSCHTRHVDEGEFTEKPHHTHACQSCGFVWRPAVVATVGVKFLPGFKD